MPRAFPIYLARTILKPVGQGHVTMSEIDGICSPGLGRNGILLRKYKTHDFAKLDILQKELHVNRIGRDVVVRVSFFFDKVLFRNHFNVRIVRVDGHRSTKSNSDRPVSCEKRPPNSFPKSLILSTQLRALHAAPRSAEKLLKMRHTIPSMHPGTLSDHNGDPSPIKNILRHICCNVRPSSVGIVR